MKTRKILGSRHLGFIDYYRYSGFTLRKKGEQSSALSRGQNDWTSQLKYFILTG
jgi:hypothetical protein